MLRAVLLSLALVFALPSLAQAEVTAADHQAIDAKVEAFFASWNAGKTEDAYRTFMLPGIKEQPQFLRQLVSVSDQVLAFFEAPFNSEKIGENIIGERLVYRRYILYNDKAPYLLDMIMFRTSSGWYAQSVSMRDLKPDDLAY